MYIYICASALPMSKDLVPAVQCGGKLQQSLSGAAVDVFSKTLRGLAATKLTKPSAFRTADGVGYAVRCSYKVHAGFVWLPLPCLTFCKVTCLISILCHLQCSVAPRHCSPSAGSLNLAALHSCFALHHHGTNSTCQHTASLSGVHCQAQCRAGLPSTARRAGCQTPCKAVIPTDLRLHTSHSINI